MAVAVHLLDPAVSVTPVTPADNETKETEVKEEVQHSQDTGANVSQIYDVGPQVGRYLRIGFFWHFDR